MTTTASVEDLAREAALETANDALAVGELLGQDTHDGIITVRFACLLPGYRGWEWSVDIATFDGELSLCESALLPGPEALRAPSWVPWSDRVRPGDLEPGMVLPYIADDPRLVPGYTATGDEDRDETAIYEFGLGRERVLAPETREAVADRWYRGSHGPTAASAVASAAPCSTCAFYVPVSGSFRMMFGVCANEWSPSDGRVVSVDHGCGAHSQTEAERRASEWPAPDPVVDTDAVEDLDLAAPDPEPEVEVAAENEAEVEAPSAEAEAQPEVAPVDEAVADVVEEIVEAPAVEASADEAAVEDAPVEVDEQQA